MADRDAGCPAPFEVCITPAGAAELDQALAETRSWSRAASRWMTEAWLRCGPPPGHPP